MVTCPNCGFQMKAKAPAGAGTTSGAKLKKLNQNKQYIVGCLSDRPQTAREIRNKLFGQGIRKTTRSGKEINWDYHAVQIELSVLVGADLISMTREQEVHDTDSGLYSTTQAPRYYLTDQQYLKLQQIIKHGGKITWELKNSAMDAVEN